MTGARPSLLARNRSRLKLGSWTLIDQVISSGTNFALLIVVARFLHPDAYGLFILAFSSWTTVVAIIRASVTQPYVVEASTASETEFRRATATAAGSALAAGIAAGAVLLVVGIALAYTRVGGGPFVVLAFVMPGLALQDFWRFAALARRSPRTAAVNDAVWAVAEGAALALLVASGNRSAALATLAWGAGGIAGALVGMRQLGVRPRLGKQAWRIAKASAGRWFGVSAAAYAGANQIVAVVLAGVVGTSGLGGLRAVQTLFGPPQLLASAGDMVALPVSSRRYRRQGRRGLTRFLIQYTIPLTVALGTFGLLLVAFRAEVVRGVLGPSFERFSNLVIPLSLGLLATSLSFGGALGLRTMLAGQRFAAAEVAAAFVQIGTITVLAWRFGVIGAAWGAAASSFAYAALVWIAYTRIRSQS